MSIMGEIGVDTSINALDARFCLLSLLNFIHLKEYTKIKSAGDFFSKNFKVLNIFHISFSI